MLPMYQRIEKNENIAIPIIKIGANFVELS